MQKKATPYSTVSKRSINMNGADLKKTLLEKFPRAGELINWQLD